MKLYTEEQVREIVRLSLEDAEASVIWSKEWYPQKLADKILQSLTPIKLPIDEEIVQASEATYREYPSNPKDHPELKYNQDINAPRKRKAFIKGANWIIEQIKQQSK